MSSSTSFPIPSSRRGNLIVKHPYFTLAALDGAKDKHPRLEWRIDPKDGILCYTLYRMEEGAEDSICAMYHHIHWDLCLSIPYSEGVLLLPDLQPESQSSADFECMVVVSLLGMLAQLRMLGSSAGKEQKSGLVGRMVRHATSVLGHHRS
jgi:hypothetical protein